MSSYRVDVKGASYTVQVKERRGAVLTLEINGTTHSITLDPSPRSHSQTPISISPIAFRGPGSSTSKSASSGGPSEIRAPLPGIVSDVKVSAGDEVKSGATLLVIDAMKMENPIKAPRDVRIKGVQVSKGQEVSHGALLISFEPSST